MERYGVSRPTLREALRVLEAESLITVRRGRGGGPTVTAPDVGLAGRYVGFLLQLAGATVGDLFQARIVIEPQLVRLLAESDHRHDAVLHLRELLEDLRKNIDDMAYFNAKASEFHRVVIDAAGNRTLAVLAGSVWHIIEHHTAHAAIRHDQEVVRYNRGAVDLYTRLVDLVERGEGEACEHLWRGHMQTFRSLMLRYEGDHQLDIT